MIYQRYIITGKVQGVFYRAETVKKAQQLGLVGWVRNLVDGSVECCACGDVVKLQQLFTWLEQGPATAKVDKVTIFSCQEQNNFTNFRIIP
jgi:acylphosphatase